MNRKGEGLLPRCWHRFCGRAPPFQQYERNSLIHADQRRRECGGSNICVITEQLSVLRNWKGSEVALLLFAFQLAEKRHRGSQQAIQENKISEETQLDLIDQKKELGYLIGRVEAYIL